MGNLTIFLGEACRTLVFPPWFVREIIAQMYHLGVKSLGLVLMAAFALGMVLAMQGLKVLSWFGAANYVATLVGMSMVRELGPIIAGIMLAARGGAGIGAELGSMRVTSQIDALTVSAVNPLKYLVITRILACILILAPVDGVRQYRRHLRRHADRCHPGGHVHHLILLFNAQVFTA
jgi:phospholipid/cholesterol/gamma-HCH transport system permease protein